MLISAYNCCTKITWPAGSHGVSLPTHISAESAPGPYVDFSPVHSTHDRAPIPLWYEPLAHGTQGSTPFSEYVPGAHFTETRIDSYWITQRVNRGFARQPCCMAGTMKMFCIRKNFFSRRKKNLLFLPCNMAAVQNLYSKRLWQRVRKNMLEHNPSKLQ